MGARNAFGQEGGGLRLDGDDLYFRIHFFEVASGAGQSPAGADGGDEIVHLSVRIGPDLRPGSGFVGRRVRRIHELPRDEAVRNAFRQLLRLRDGSGHALCSGRQDDLRAVGLHQGDALRAHGVGHDDDEAVSPGCRHGGEADAGVPGGGLDDDGTGLQKALRLRIIQHAASHPVLRGAGGIQELQLRKKTRAYIFRFFDMGQLKERGAADQLVCRSIDFCHGIPSGHLNAAPCPEGRERGCFFISSIIMTGKKESNSQSRKTGTCNPEKQNFILCHPVLKWA